MQIPEMATPDIEIDTPETDTNLHLASSPPDTTKKNEKPVDVAKLTKIERQRIALLFYEKCKKLLGNEKDLKERPIFSLDGEDWTIIKIFVEIWAGSEKGMILTQAIFETIKKDFLKNIQNK